MLISELKQLQLKSETISIERDCSEDELTGLIALVTENIVAMHLYTDNGNYDGFTVFKTEQITEVFWGNREHRAIAHLITQAPSQSAPTIKSSSFRDIVIELDAKFESMCFYTNAGEDAFSIGRIEKFDETWMKVKTFGVKNTLSQKFVIFLRDTLTRIDVNSPYQNKMVDLHQQNL